MRTPAGQECLHYYEDFYRGAEKRECRARKSPRSAPWSPQVCRSCPVPGIFQANASPYLDLIVKIRRRPLGLGIKVEVEARCTLHGEVADPYRGCRECCEELPEA